MKISQLIIESNEILKNSNIDSYKLDSQLILSKVINKDKLFILINREWEVEDKLVDEFFSLINKRKNKMPVKYILNECEFMGLDFWVEEGVLIPRPDTEILVEKAIEEIKENKFKKICDVCCGSGAIGLSIAKLLNDLEITLFDISEKAIEVTKKNMHKFDLENKAEVYYSDLLKEAKINNMKFDMILSNPPYIRKSIIPTLMEDVKDYEPMMALDGGEDGLDFYHRITLDSKEILNENGMIIYEIGHDQKEDVMNILVENGFCQVEGIKDLAGNDRVVLGRLKEP
ncbi:peptide chain release factor N(5)-glutamine methyltransferase [Clostridium grantii]|uniref:Release factor glutamine methyltransferase n=1 Tax=Clostridium grantii DSM 8605 TaxID=1121316 RepID=A0A1M5TL09_9CLOT|nr:peptide chain release factor N(5)-glutamine methyltransferase [Clostridium grantii]SHH51063.1 release factor glutamine methyltransferase [Clostridium grantii DSM 8605]